MALHKIFAMNLLLPAKQTQRFDRERINHGSPEIADDNYDSVIAERIALK